jgi:hypothetical protein
MRQNQSRRLISAPWSVADPGPARIWLELEASDGAKFSDYITFNARSEKVPHGISSEFLEALKKPFIDRQESWDCHEVGNRLFITSWRGADGTTSRIISIRLTSNGTFQSNQLPGVIASESVTVQRDLDPPTNKK